MLNKDILFSKDSVKSVQETIRGANKEMRHLKTHLQRMTIKKWMDTLKVNAYFKVYVIWKDWIGLQRVSPRHWNTGLVSSGDSLTSWGGASLALVGNPSSVGVTIKMPCGVDVLHHVLHPAWHLIFSYWVC